MNERDKRERMRGEGAGPRGPWWRGKSSATGSPHISRHVPYERPPKQSLHSQARVWKQELKSRHGDPLQAGRNPLPIFSALQWTGKAQGRQPRTPEDYLQPCSPPSTSLQDNCSQSLPRGAATWADKEVAVAWHVPARSHPALHARDASVWLSPPHRHSQ